MQTFILLTGMNQRVACGSMLSFGRPALWFALWFRVTLESGFRLETGLH